MFDFQQRVEGFTDYLKANAPEIQVVAVVNEDGSAKCQTDAAATLEQEFSRPDFLRWRSLVSHKA